MKKIFFFIITLLISILTSCKNDQQNSQNIEKKADSINVTSVLSVSDTVQSSLKETVDNNYGDMVNLPFDYENVKKLSNTDKSKYLALYPQLDSEKLVGIKKIISSNTEDNPDEIFQINNGNLSFSSYVYCTSGDSDSQTLINIKEDKMIATESIGYSMPEGNETYQSFVINKDLSIYIYDVQFNSGTRKILEKHQIKPDGTIVKVK